MGFRKVCVLLPACSGMNILVHIPLLDGVKQTLRELCWAGFWPPGVAVVTSQVTQSPGSTSRSSQSWYSDELLLHLVLTHPHLSRGMWWPPYHHKYLPTCAPRLLETSLPSHRTIFGLKQLYEVVSAGDCSAVGWWELSYGTASA